MVSWFLELHSICEFPVLHTRGSAAQGVMIMNPRIDQPLLKFPKAYAFDITLTLGSLRDLSKAEEIPQDPCTRMLSMLSNIAAV